MNQSRKCKRIWKKCDNFPTIPPIFVIFIATVKVPMVLWHQMNNLRVLFKYATMNNQHRGLLHRFVKTHIMMQWLSSCPAGLNQRCGTQSSLDSLVRQSSPTLKQLLLQQNFTGQRGSPVSIVRPMQPVERICLRNCANKLCKQIDF